MNYLAEMSPGAWTVFALIFAVVIVWFIERY